MGEVIRTPVSPRVHEELTHILTRHFDAQPGQAAKLATKLINTLRQYDLDVIRGNWMEQDPVREVKEDRWTTLALAAEGLVQERGGIKPWLPPELQ